MARFVGLNVQTDILVNVPVGTAPATVARFRPADLLTCVAVHSPTEVESLTVEVRRTDARASELVVGRVLRVVTEGGTDDTEWDITSVTDTSTADRLTITATPILLRLARVVYVGTDATTGAADFAYAGVEQTATEWMNQLVLPALASAGMAFELGTVDSTTRFALDGEWASVLEIVRAIAAPGHANAEVRLRMGGDYGYVIDLLDTIGGSASTVRVRTAVTLLETQRERSLIEVAGRLIPRGASASVATRTMSDHYWRIAAVVSGTVLELEDPWGGADPIAYDDQLNGFYLAVANDPTFASTIVTDSVASTQRVTIGSTAGMTAGELVRFFAATGATGARVTSLTHPATVDHPADGGYGDRAQILDRPAVVADTNMVVNGTQRTWTVAADPPDNWTEYATDTSDVTFQQVTTDGPETFTQCFEVTLASGGGNVAVVGAFQGGSDADTVQGPAIAISSPLAYPWNTLWRRYTATVWLNVQNAPTGGRVKMYLYDQDRTDALYYRAEYHAGTIGEWVKGTDSEDTWIRFESAALDLSGVVGTPIAATLNGGVRVRVELTRTGDPTTAEVAGAWQGVWDAGTAYSAATPDYVSYAGELYVCTTGPSTGDTPPGTDWTLVSGATRIADVGWQVRVGPVTVAEASEPIADREGSGGTQLWQEVNAALPTTINPIKGYDLRVADVAADDPTTFATMAFTPGGLIEVTDTDLGVVTTLRLIEYGRDYLQPLASRLRVGRPADTFTRLVEAGLVTTAGRV